MSLKKQSIRPSKPFEYQDPLGLENKKKEIIIKFGYVFIAHLAGSLDEFKDLIAKEIEQIFKSSDPRNQSEHKN